jgi:hypothetical protein
MVYSKLIKYVLLLFGLFANKTTHAQVPEKYIVVVNEAVNSSIKKKELNAYLKGEKNYWPNGSRVIISLPSPKTELADEVAQGVFKTNVMGMQKYWLSLVFQGRVDPPYFMMTDEETIAFVRSTKGAFGIIQTKNKSLAADLIINFKEQTP